MQRFIGVVLGAVVTYALLVLLNIGDDPNAKYGAAVVIGAIVSWLWPWVIGIVLVRRAKQRRSDEINKEVADQLAAERKG